MNSPRPPSLARPLVAAEAILAPENALPPIVVDCRFDLSSASAGSSRYIDGHIPGARYLHLENDLSGRIQSGRTGRHPLPDPDALRGRFAQIGVDAEGPVVFYDDAGGAFAARAWWLACWLGHPCAHVLDGGWARWLEAGGAVEKGTPADVANAPGWPMRAPLLTAADASDVIGSFTNDTALIDARAAQRFEGIAEPIDPVAGHIPGARCMPHTANLGPDGTFLGAEALIERWGAVLGNDSGKAICYCGSGVTAAHNVLAATAAGFAPPRLYVGSWSEWITDPGRAIATGPGTHS